MARAMTQEERRKRSESAKADWSKRRIQLPMDRIEELYFAGMSISEIADEFGVSHKVIWRRVHELGIIRTKREASAVMFARMSDEKRAGWATHLGNKGNSMSAKIKRAKTREDRQVGIVPLEKKLKDWLTERGLSVICQKACGPYNIDLAVDNAIAIELQSGHGRILQPRAAQREPGRTKHLISSGWSLLVVWVDTHRRDISLGVVDHVIDFLSDAHASKGCIYREVRA